MYLAIECGATSSVVLLLDKNENTIEEKTFGSANYKLMTAFQLEELFTQIRYYFNQSSIQCVGVGMPGILNDSDKKSVEKVIRKLWTEVERVWVGSDLETALACIDNNEYGVRLIVVAGTGSCSYGTNGKVTGKVGGYGHRIGDRGSGYAIAERALKLALRQHEHNCAILDTADSDKISSCLLSTMMKELGLISIQQLVLWSLSAKKEEIASLAPIVLSMWKQGDKVAKSVLENALNDLVVDCISLLNKLLLQNSSESSEKGSEKKSSSINPLEVNVKDDGVLIKTSVTQNCRVRIGITGSLFTKDNEFAQVFSSRLSSQMPEEMKCSVERLENTAKGSVKTLVLDTAPEDYENDKGEKVSLLVPNQNLISPNTSLTSSGGKEVDSTRSENELADNILPICLGLSLTEKRNEKSMNLDRMNVEDGIDLMLGEEESIFKKISEHKKSIGILVERVCTAFQKGGRLFYVGAGTSGRLGILDATECPPTFTSPQEWVQGIIAGGFSSVSKAKEGAEDSISDGIKAIQDRNVNYNDVVLGIAACGRTPFVWGSIDMAKSVGAFTAFLTFNTELELKIHPDLFIAIDVGAEVLTGSTRLKCGTATKCILNIISTLAMVKYGKCFENLMVDLNPANQKLKQRSLRIVLLMTNHVPGNDEEKVKEILVRNNYNIRKTVMQLRNEHSHIVSQNCCE